MLVDTCILLFALILLTLLIIKNLPHSNSIFTLYNLFIVFALAEVPYLFYLNHNNELIHNYVKPHIEDYELVFVKHIILKLAFITIALFSMHTFNPRASILKRTFSVKSFNNRHLLFTSISFSFLALIAFSLFLHKVGGLTYLMLNISNKTIVVQGTGLYRNLIFLSSLLSLGFYIHYLSRLKKVDTFRAFVFLFLIILLFSVLASSGERKNPLLLIVYVIILWNFTINRIRILSARYLPLLLFFIIFAAIIPPLRIPGATDYYLQHPFLLANDSIPYVGEIFKRFSEIDISLFIYSFFDNTDKLWLGASIPDFFTGVVPSAFFPNKPPLDEGVYIYALAHYYDVSPPTPFKDMLPVGWPLSRVTGPYVHFGTIGVIVSAFITGLILKYFYNLLLATNYSPQAMLIYTVLLSTNFGLTNAFLANIFLTLFLVIILSICFKLIMPLGSNRGNLN
jgi:hypothetical protein